MPLLVAAFAVYGLGVGAVDAGMNMQGVRVQSAYGYSIMASFHGMWSVGGIAGALYAAGVAEIGIPLAVSLIVIAIVTALVTLVAAAVPHEARDIAIARMNIANYVGAILGGGLIGAAASAGHLRWAFAIPVVLVPVVLLVARSFRASDEVRL